MSEELPPQPRTMELPAADKQDILLAEVRRGFSELRADISLVANDVSIVKDRVAVVEGRVNALEEARKTTSMRVADASKADLEHEAQLAQERAAREELAAKVDALAKTNEVQLAILARLDHVAKNPLVKTLAAMLATAAITWLASHGVVIVK